MSVRVPVGWKVETVTAGPGSQEFGNGIGTTVSRCTSPSLTWPVRHWRAPPRLEQAMAAEAPGVFRDFDAVGRRAGRLAVTYRGG